MRYQIHSANSFCEKIATRNRPIGQRIENFPWCDHYECSVFFFFMAYRCYYHFFFRNRPPRYNRIGIRFKNPLHRVDGARFGDTPRERSENGIGSGNSPGYAGIAGGGLNNKQRCACITAFRMKTHEKRTAASRQSLHGNPRPRAHYAHVGRRRVCVRSGCSETTAAAASPNYNGSVNSLNCFFFFSKDFIFSPFSKKTLLNFLLCLFFFFVLPACRNNNVG